MADEAARSREDSPPSEDSPSSQVSPSAEAPAADEDDDDTRRLFREALERKKHENHRFNEHHESGGKGVGHSQVLSGRRQFRRKSG